jgi:hypothetical protein
MNEIWSGPGRQWIGVRIHAHIRAVSQFPPLKGAGAKGLLPGHRMLHPCNRAAAIINAG